MRPRFAQDDLVGADLIWLLSLTWAGRTYRWSSRPCTPEDADGDAVPHDGGLPDLTLDERFTLLSLAPDARSVALELDFPVDVATLVQAGHDLASATGELSLWRVGDAYEDRVPMLVGRVRDPEYGAEGEPVACSLEQEPWDDRALIPASAARVTADTWPDAASAAKGLYYPVVFGAPGVIREADGASAVTSGSPALVVAWDSLNEVATKVLIAGHEVAADNVTIYSADGQSSISAPVVHETDGLGRTVATVDLSGADPTFAEDTEYWVGWSDGAGLLLPDRSGAIIGAGDLILWALRGTSVTVDVGRFEAARQTLNAFRFAGYIDEAVTPWEWLTDNILPLLPLSLGYGPDGYYPIVWRLDAQAKDALAHLRAGPGLVRTGPVRYVRGARDVTNEIRLSFAPRARTGEFRRVLTCTPDPDLDDADQFTTHYALISASRYGVQGETIETDVVYDTNTAGQVLTWKVRALALPIRSITYEGGVEWGWLAHGDVVLLTDADIALDGQVLLVECLRWVSEVALELDLLLVEDPARDR